MNDQEILDRFEELEAGRIIGDLDADEVKEWEALSQDPRCQSDFSLEFAAAALESGYTEPEEGDFPEELAMQLKAGMSDFIVAEPAEDKIIRPPAWRRLLSDGETAWVVAAVLALLLAAKFMVSSEPSDPVSAEKDVPVMMTPEEAREAFVSSAPDLVKSSFDGLGEYGEMAGSVVWSDELQEGYMSLANLPVNDPEAKQYQLWIVDPDRDEKPVDGGVFDIPRNAPTAIIPIRNPLLVTNPKAFVITLEQPGGVVVSKQEVVVALAKTS